MQLDMIGIEGASFFIAEQKYSVVSTVEASSDSLQKFPNSEGRSNSFPPSSTFG